jgi:UDP-N-acetylmuramoyl-L-alanyl-D-glutamate--2,6-diaminopimelate ligase
MLKKAKENNCEYAIIETASHWIKMHRVWWIQYDIAVLTNISRDHLDLHKTMDDYVNTKLLLFKNLIGFDRKKWVKKCFVINNNSKYSDLFLSETSDICYTYWQWSTVDLKATNIKYYQNKTIFDIKIAWSNIHIDTSLIWNFNVSNILASVWVLLSLWIKSDIISKAINSIETIPWRFETIDNILWINIIVDYAHTPDALEKVLLTIKNLNKVWEIITVFWATWDRDKTKRPIMWEIVSKYSDKIILTQDDDYTENRDQIIKEVEKWITLEKNKDFFIIPDRYKAIKASIILAKKNDFLLIAWKWDEHILVTNSWPIKWHDKSIIEKIINNINNTK